MVAAWLHGDLVFRAADDEDIRDLVVFAPSEVAPWPAGAKLGINYLATTEVILALQAPGKKIAHVIGDFNDWKVLPEYQLKKTSDGAIFWIKLTGLVPQKEYIFQYLVDGDIRIGDPYADKVSDPFNDQEIITQNRHPGLLPYPTGKTEFQATFLQRMVAIASTAPLSSSRSMKKPAAKWVSTSC